MKITVKLFAYFTNHLPPGSKKQATEITIPDGSVAEDALKSLGVPTKEARIGLFNGITHTDPENWLKYELKEGDTLAVLPNIH